MVSVATDSAQRILHDGENQSEFGLEVRLQGIDVEVSDEGSSSDGGSAIIYAVVVLILLAAGGCFGFVVCTRRNGKEDPEDIVDHNSSNASVGTFTNKSSEYSPPSKDQQIN